MNSFKNNEWIKERHNEDRKCYGNESNKFNEIDDIDHSSKVGIKKSKVVWMKIKNKENIKLDKEFNVKDDDDKIIWNIKRFPYGQYYK